MKKLTPLTLAAACAAPASAVELTGVSLASAEFEVNYPGEYVRDYLYPNLDEVDYFLEQGMNSFRLPFRWERLQNAAFGEFNAAELQRMDTFVNGATARGATVILDPHNFARYYPEQTPETYQNSAQGLIGSDVPETAFADLWGRLATRYGGNDKVVFGLMNEPNAMPTEQWVSAANAAIVAIRDTGADNLVLVPGNGFTGAFAWNLDYYGTPNAVALLDITDPADNVAFEVHQYLNSDFSGNTPEVQSETIGVDSLRVVTEWLIENDKRAYLGEFAAGDTSFGDGPDQLGDEAITLMLEHMDQNDDRWIGWAWWAAGPYFGVDDYFFDLNTTEAGGPDAVQLDVLRPFFAGTPVPEPATLAPVAIAPLLLRRRRA